MTSACENTLALSVSPLPSSLHLFPEKQAPGLFTLPAAKTTVLRFAVLTPVKTVLHRLIKLASSSLSVPLLDSLYGGTSASKSNDSESDSVFHSIENPIE